MFSYIVAALDAGLKLLAIGSLGLECGGLGLAKWSCLHHWKREKTRELPGERDNARNNARCAKARKTTHGLDGQHQDVDRTPRERVNQNNRGQG